MQETEGSGKGIHCEVAVVGPMHRHVASITG